MPRARTETEKFRAFITGKTTEELLAMMERLQDVLAVTAPKTASADKKRKRVKPMPLLDGDAAEAAGRADHAEAVSK